QRTVIVTIFEYRWQCLLKKYNQENVISYLQRLYANKESWANAFILKFFTAGMSSMSRVESYNSKVKKLIFNSNTSLLELIEKLTVCIVEEDKKMDLLRKYLTIEILKIQEDQIKQSL
ncbi:5088_t:CDS:2, partial [Gigaspora margarita]